MCHNEAYNFHSSSAFAKAVPVKPVDINISELNPHNPVAPVTNPPHHEAKTCEDPESYVYEYIGERPVSKAVSDTALTHHGEDKSATRAESIVKTSSTSNKDSEDYYTPMKSEASNQNIHASSNPCLLSSDQVKLLIEMLKTIPVSDHPQGASNSTLEGAVSIISQTVSPQTESPKRSQTDLVTSKDVPSHQNSHDHPSQLNPILSDTIQPTVYYNTVTVASEKQNESPTIKDGEELTLPKLIVESTDDDSAVPVQRSKSVHLTTAARANITPLGSPALRRQSEGLLAKAARDNVMTCKLGEFDDLKFKI